MTPTCQSCGVKLAPPLWPDWPAGRPAAYCAPACRQAGWRQRRLDRFRRSWEDEDGGEAEDPG
jgi:hypothetical protein